MSRLVRGIAVTLGAGALMAAAFTQGVTPPPASTVQSGTHASGLKPITLGMIPPVPSTSPTPKSTTQNANANEAYDYINPCSLIPLDRIHSITGDKSLKYDSRHGGMTTNVADANTVELVNGTLPRVCSLSPEAGYVKPVMFVGVKTQQSTADFLTFRNYWTGYMERSAQDVGVFGLPAAREATAIYATNSGTRFYWMLFVHTKYNQTLIVKWSGKQPALPVMQQLAYEALRTMDGSRYTGK